MATDGPVGLSGGPFGDALAAGATENEVVGVLLYVAGLAGVARVGATVRKVALAMDYDLDASLEYHEPRGV